MKIIFTILSIFLFQTNENIKKMEQQVKQCQISQTEGKINKKSNLRVTYEERINFPETLINKMPENIRTEVRKLKNNPEIYLLNYNGEMADYRLKNEASKATVISDGKSSSFELAEYSTYKDYMSNELVIRTGVMNKKYLINKEIVTYNWKITGETKKFGKFNAKRAVAKIGDQMIVAYYTDEVGINEGPSIYNGLPGLIIYLEAPDRNYLAVKIEYPEKLIVNEFKVGEKIGEKEYKELVEKTKNKTVIKQNIEKHEN